jgi:putative DNA primase/helicase
MMAQDELLDMTMGAFAKTYAREGFRVFPLAERTKSQPLVKGWEDKASSDLAQIESWWRWQPRANIALLCGSQTGLLVVDVDPRHDGDKTLARLIKKHGELPPTLTAKTGGGGWHYFFRFDRFEAIAGKGALGEGIELQHPTNGYVVAAPSIHPSGGMYWLSSLEAPIAEAPDWIVEEAVPRASGAKSRRRTRQKPVGKADATRIHEGSRNDELFRFASLLRGQGASETVIEKAVLALNAELASPLEESEVLTLVRSASKYEPNENGSVKMTAAQVGQSLQGRFQLATFKQDVPAALVLYEDGGYRLAEKRLKEAITDILSNSWTDAKSRDALKWLSLKVPVLDEIPPTDRINVLNGIFNLRTGELEEHSEDFRSPIQIPIRYDKRARCPGIEHFLEEMLAPEDVKLFYEIAGWLLVPDITRKLAVLFFGPTDTGKTVAIEILQSLLGLANFSTLTLNDISSRFRVAGVVGKLANFFDDLPPTRIHDSGNFKALTGRGYLTVENKFQEPYTIRPFARLVFAANEAPGTVDTTGAYFNRWLVMSFKNKPERKDPRLTAKLTTPEELSGLLNKALAALSSNPGRFSESKSAEKALMKFRTDADPEASFLRERYIYQEGAKTPRADFNSQYELWCRKYHKQPMSRQKLGEHLNELPEWRENVWLRPHRGEYFYIGIRRRESSDR